MKSNQKFKLLLVALFGGVGFFLLSGAIFPENRQLIDATHHFTAIPFENHAFQITSWEFSPSDAVMEAIIEIESGTILPVEWNVEVVERTQGLQDANIVHRNENALLIRIENLRPTWREIGIRIFQGERSNQRLTLYTNHEHIKRVDELPLLTSREYEIKRVMYLMKGIENERETIQNQILEHDSQIEALLNRIQELIDGTFITTEEARNAERIIIRANDEIISHRSSITRLLDECSVLEDRYTGFYFYLQTLQSH